MFPSDPLEKDGSDTVARAPEATAHLDRGKTFWSQGAYDRALAAFSEAIRQDSTDAEAYLLRGEVFEARGDRAQAIEDFSEVINLDFHRVLNCANRVLLHTRLHQFDEGAAVARETLPLNRRLARAYFLRGRAYAEQAEQARAVADFTQTIELEPDNSAAFVQRGDAYFKTGDQGRAIADYSAALRLDPDKASSWSKRGEAFHRQGDYDQALADFTESLQRAPECAASFAGRGAVHWDKGEHEQALEDYNRAIHLDPHCPRFHVQRSMIHAARCDYERALADFGKALALDPRNYFSHENQDIARRLKEEYDQSVVELNRVRSDFQKAVANFAQAMDLAPRQPALPPPADPRLARDDANGAIKAETFALTPPGEDDTDLEPEPEAPHDDYDAPLEQASEEETLSRDDELAAEEHYRQAQFLHARGEHDQALKEYTKALQLDPDCLAAYLERGRIYRTHGRFKRAIADFTAALAIDDGNAEAYLRRGNAYAGKGEYESAIADYNAALEFAPDLGLAYVNRGLAFAKLGAFDRVIADADRALQLDPRLTGALFIRGAAYFKQERSELAIADFDMLLLLEPKHVLACNERGLVRASRGEYDLAVADYSRALRLDPRFELALFNRAIAYRLGGEHDKAIAEFTEVIARTPENAAAHYQRGLVYFDQKEHDRAISDLTRAFQIDPQCKEAYTSCLEVLRAKHEKQTPTLAAPILPAGEMALQEETPPVETSSAPPVRSKVEETPSAPPKRPRRVEPPPPTAPALPAAETAAATALEEARTVVNVGKLRLECPTCETQGLLDVRNLKKAFRCPGCGSWWRTDNSGRLIGATPAEGSGVEVEVWSNTGGRSKHHVPSEEKTPTGAKPTLPENRKPRKPPSRTRPRRSSEGMLRSAGGWIATASATRGGRWAMAGGLVFILASVGFAVSPLLWPGQLKTRSQSMVRAWLAKDAKQMEQLTDPTQTPYLSSWLDSHPPPDLTGQEPAPEVRISVQRNDGKSADVMIQIAAKDKKGQPAHYVFHHRWVDKGAGWLFHPQEAKKSLKPAIRTDNSRPGGRR